MRNQGYFVCRESGYTLEVNYIPKINTLIIPLLLCEGKSGDRGLLYSWNNLAS